jgi:SPP1 family predicted phage head-tail adaptor
MRSGGLRDRVTILKLSVAADATGYEVETWTTVAEVWGQLVEDKGSESLQNDRPIAFRRGSVYLRYRTDLTPKHKLKIRSVTWDIESVRTIENRSRTEGLEVVVRSND